MSSKQSLSIIAGLILLNIVTVLYFVFGTDKKENTSEIVASVGNEEITRADWIDKLETMHGKDILQAMINEEVILQMAAKHELTVSDDELNIESVIQRVLYGIDGNSSAYSKEEDFKNDLKVKVILEKLLTKDVVITDQEAELYYKDNESLQKISDFYHLSHIVVAKETEADAINKELKAGADFAEIAKQHSNDRYSADKGGDLGYVSLESEVVPNEYKEIISALKVGQSSEPIQIKEGYAILYVNNQIEESELSLNKIESVLKRKIAMEQINTPVSTEAFWKSLNVDWIYGK